MNTPYSPLGDRASLFRAHRNLKKAAGVCTRICPSLSAAHQHRCSSVFQADASAPPFFISLGRQNGQAQLYFHQGKVRITHHSSWLGSLSLCWRDGSGLCRTLGEKGMLGCFAPASVAMPWSRNPCPKPQSKFPAAGAHGGFSHRMGASPSAPGSTVSFPVLAARGTSSTSAYRTLLGHNSLHDLIILIGINWGNNSLFQQE